MKKSVLGFVFTVMICALSLTTNAQKYGYINSAQLLMEMPEIKSADAELNTYQTQLVAKGQEMVKAFEAKYQSYMAEAEKGALSQIQMQQKEGELTNEQQEIQQYEVEVQNKITEKREKLYQPILDKVKTVIETIGKEQGYTMIFDSSSGGILSAEESADLLNIVKTKLGI